jgi:hypothetical protein
MSVKNKEARVSRRWFLKGAALLLGASFWPTRPLRAQTEPATALPSDRLQRLLESSEFVYVSPLKSNGRESRCHGEVWYAWLDGTVVLITARSAWKGRALARGLDRARIWVGDHGRVKGFLFDNEDFRSAPYFEARARIDPDPELLERLMAVYAKKYPEEFADWEPDMRSGFASGERVIVRYAA